MAQAGLDELYVALGKLVQTARKQANLTQDDLARRVGLTRTSITNIERGRQKIQIHTLYALAEALGVGPDALLPQPRAEPAEEIEERLPQEMPPAEREWVKRVLTTKAG